MLQKSSLEPMIVIVHIYTGIYYNHCHKYNFIGGVAQTDNKTINEQTDGELLYPDLSMRTQ